MIYTVTLNPALDYDIYMDKMVLKELNDVKNVKFRAGGKGINVSIMLNNLIEKSIATGFIAGFTGDYILNNLNEQNIMCDFIKVEGTTRINVKLNTNEGETEIAGLSQYIDEKNYKKLINKVSNLKSSDILVLSGSIPNCLEKDTYLKISKCTKAKIVLDTRGDILLQNICNNLLIKPNIKELEQAFSKKLETTKEVYEACKVFLKKGVENVLVSMGEKGAILIKKGKAIKASIPKGEMINTIGAGDSTVAGFLKAYENGLNDIDTLKLAVACGSATAYSLGIGKSDLVYKLIENIECEEISYEN